MKCREIFIAHGAATNIYHRLLNNLNGMRHTCCPNSAPSVNTTRTEAQSLPASRQLWARQCICTCMPGVDLSWVEAVVCRKGWVLACLPLWSCGVEDDAGVFLQHNRTRGGVKKMTMRLSQCYTEARRSVEEPVHCLMGQQAGGCISVKSCICSRSARTLGGLEDG